MISVLGAYRFSAVAVVELFRLREGSFVRAGGHSEVAAPRKHPLRSQRIPKDRVPYKKREGRAVLKVD